MNKHIDLNDNWKYSSTFQKQMTEASYDEMNMQTIRIPHSNVITPLHYFDETIYQFISCYRKHIFADEEWKGRQVLVTFEGVAHVCNVYLNGKSIAEHFGGYTAFTLDLAPYLNYGYDNILSLEVDSRETNNLPPFGYVIDYMTYGGIYREVYLDIKEQISIEDAFIITRDVEEDINIVDKDNIVNKTNKSSLADLTDKTNITYKIDKTDKADKVDKVNKAEKTDTTDITKITEIGQKKIVNNCENKEIEIQVSLHGLDQKHEVKLRYSITDTKNNQIYLGDASLTEEFTTIKFQVEGVTNWDTEHPVLYFLHLELLDLNREMNLLIDTKTIRFGFRTCEFKEDGFYLNHNKIKLIGLNRHQSYPYVGYAMPKRMQQRDAEILKNELFVNAVRTSHYPQSKHFIDRCDELGLLVFTEIPGWQHIGNEDWKKIACEHVKEMVVQYRNHPSIILWGVRINESLDDNEFYKKTNQIAHQLDKSRQTGGVRYLKKSNLLEDVYTYNDFLHNGTTKGIERKKDVTSRKQVPYLVSEYNGHMFPTKSFDCEEHRLEHALRHANVLDALFEQDGVAGGFGWCMFDYNTHKDFGSGDRICYHGVMDMFRNPKLAASVYASQSNQSDVCEVSSSLDIGDHPAGNTGDIYVFTNADSVKLYKNDIFIKEFYPNKAKYPTLPHPPIIIDDFVGDLIEQKERFNHNTAEVLKKTLYAVKKYGQNSLPLKYKLKMAFLMLKEHISINEGIRLYSQYIGSWGGEVTTFRFEAIKDNTVFKVIEKKPVIKPRLSVVTKDIRLKEEETYDVAEIRITAIDESGTILPYYQEPILLEAWGAVELIGPKVISLKGGMGGTYIRTKGIQGEGGVKIYQADLGESEVVFEVV